MSIRVLIADDQQLVRSGFRVLLDAEPDIEVVGEAADGVAAVAEARRLRPDIVLMDIRMPHLDGIEATRSITNSLPGTRVIILTTYYLDEYVFDALRVGAYGFLLKDVRTAELADAVRTVNDGGALLAPTVTLRMISQFARSPSPAQRDRLLAKLTPREGEVLKLVGHGLSNTEIAARLVISQATAKTHVARILLKLGLRDRVQAAVLAYERGVVVVGQDTPSMLAQPRAAPDRETSQSQDPKEVRTRVGKNNPPAPSTAAIQSRPAVRSFGSTPHTAATHRHGASIKQTCRVHARLHRGKPARPRNPEPPAAVPNGRSGISPFLDALDLVG